jgi:hypothetical protein
MLAIATGLQKVGDVLQHFGVMRGNVPPNTGKTDREVGRLKQAASRWLERNDKQARRVRKPRKLQDRKDAEQAKRNPALVAEYRRAMLKTR